MRISSCRYFWFLWDSPITGKNWWVFMKQNEINFSFYERGDGESCLFLHGSRDRKEVFERLVPYLKEQYHLVFLDMRGHGDTEAPLEGYTFEQFISDIDVFTESRAMKSFHLIGHSLGGVISILYTLKYPEKVKSLVLMGSSAYFIPKFKRPLVGASIDKEQIKNTNQNAIPYFFQEKYMEVQEEILSNWEKVPPHVHEEMIRMGHPDLREKIKDITRPTLVIVGEKDRICTVEDGELLHKGIRGSKIKVIHDAAHFMFMEKPQEVSEVISGFLKNNEKD